jgi:hypothetical protein
MLNQGPALWLSLRVRPRLSRPPEWNEDALEGALRRVRRSLSCSVGCQLMTAAIERAVNIASRCGVMARYLSSYCTIHRSDHYILSLHISRRSWPSGGHLKQQVSNPSNASRASFPRPQPPLVAHPPPSNQRMAADMARRPPPIPSLP